MKNFIEQDGFIDYMNITIKFKKNFAISTSIPFGYILDIIELIYGTKTSYSVFPNKAKGPNVYFYNITYEE